MRSILCLTGLILASQMSFAAGEIQKGRFVSADMTIGQETLTSEYCNNKPGERWNCGALVFKNAVLKNEKGEEIKVDRLAFPAQTSGGFMGMGPSEDLLFIAFALSPKDKWEPEFQELIDSAEMSEITFVTLADNQISTGGRGSKISLAKAEVKITFSKKTREEMLEQMKKDGEHPVGDVAKGIMTRKFGEYLDLEKLAQDK